MLNKYGGWVKQAGDMMDSDNHLDDKKFAYTENAFQKYLDIAKWEFHK